MRSELQVQFGLSRTDNTAKLTSESHRLQSIQIDSGTSHFEGTSDDSYYAPTWQPRKQNMDCQMEGQQDVLGASSNTQISSSTEEPKETRNYTLFLFFSII